MTKLRVMPDLGVLVAVLLAPLGASAVLYRRWLNREFELVVASGQLSQLETLLSRRSFERDYVRPGEAKRFLSFLEANARVVRHRCPADVSGAQLRISEVARAEGVDVLTTLEQTHFDLDVAVAPLVLAPTSLLRFLDAERQVGSPA